MTKSELRDKLFDSRKVILAPMAGVTDPVFRLLCREMGAQLTFTEMVSAKGLSYENKKTQHLVDLGKDETEIAVQLFGHEPESMADQAAWIEQELGSNLVLIDVNMGCPVRKIVSKGDGSALMKHPDLAQEIIYKIKSRVSVPVTCKFRRSWDDTGKYLSAKDFAVRMQDAGVDGVTIHGRYSVQMYKGTSDRQCIKDAKAALSIPVIGNGDTFEASHALSFFKETNCDAVMVARGAQGNPWIFAEINAALEGKEYKRPSSHERINLLRRHVQLVSESKHASLSSMRKHAMWYVKGLPGASVARGEFCKCTSLDDFMCVLEKLEEACYAARSL